MKTLHLLAMIGTANSWVFLMNKLWGTEKMKDYLRELIKQDPAIGRNLRLQAEWLARGKNPVGLALYGDNVTEFKKQGAPVDYVRTIEGGHVSTAAGTLAIPSRQLPHPNAAKVFANWILTREGQALLSPGINRPSARTDVGAAGLEDFLAKPGDPITREDEDDILKKDHLSDVAREVLAPLFR
ncbi:MAG: ABC transporter substrate-binding protein [Chloroflexi bacterium]|nr:ABC transporter substrate-binding protein [Chloroflexota bacterium]